METKPSDPVATLKAPPSRTRFLHVILLAMFGLVTVSGSYFAVARLRRVTNKGPQPRLTLPIEQVDLGEHAPGKLVRGDFVVRNDGDGRLDFALYPSCGCTEVKPRNGAMRPGESQRINFAVKVGGYPGVRSEVSILLQSNDSKRPESTILLVATTAAPLIVSPQIVAFGEVPEGTSRTKSIRVEAPARPLKRRDVRWKCESRFIRVVPRGSVGKAFVLDAEMLSNAPRGVISTRIELSVDAVGKLVVPVRGRVVGPFDVIPPVAFLPTESGVPRDGPLEIRIRRWNGSTVPEIQSITAPKRVAVAALPEKDGKRLRLKVDGRLSSSSSTPEEITIRFSGIRERLRIPVKPITR